MADENVIIYATLTPKPGKEAELEKLLRGMCQPSRAEAGCVMYDLYRSSNHGTFHFFEIWKTQRDIEAHREEPHFKSFRASLGELTEGPPQPNFLERVDSRT
jgi:quinol monooxygenase YgiN